jgi:hypothetical protein
LKIFDSPAWQARVKDLAAVPEYRGSALKTWKEWIEAAVDSFKDEEIEEERQRQIALGCHAGPPIARLMAYRGPNPENWNKSSLHGEVLREDVVANKSLTRLFLEQNTLTSFPTNMLNMTSLTELWLRYATCSKALSPLYSVSVTSILCLFYFYTKSLFPINILNKASLTELWLEFAGNIRALLPL